MRKIYILLFSVFVCVLCLYVDKSGLSLSADYDTGHNEYVSIEFEDGGGHLLKQISGDEKNAALKKVKWAFFGWKEYEMRIDVIGSYVGKTIFSRSNRTGETIDFSYSSSLEETKQSSITSEGSIGGEINAKGKTLSGGLEGKIRKTIGTVNSTKSTEKTSFKVNIKPGYKVSMVAKGDVRINNGAAKYYFFGITTKKGLWEILDVMSEYYELVEEAI